MSEIERIVYGIIESVMKSDKYNINEKLEQVRVAISILILDKRRKKRR